MWLGAVSVWTMTSITIVVAFVQTSLFQQQKYNSYASKCHFIPLTKFGWVLVRSKNAAADMHLYLHENRAGGTDDDDVIHSLSELRQSSYHKLLKLIPPSVQIVLIGEGTHGTEEFFRIRSEVTQSLIQHHGFNAILCEGDVHPFFELNNYVTNNKRDKF
jgi:hypothetical protein